MFESRVDEAIVRGDMKEFNDVSEYVESNQIIQFEGDGLVYELTKSDDGEIFCSVNPSIDSTSDSKTRFFRFADKNITVQEVLKIFGYVDNYSVKWEMMESDMPDNTIKMPVKDCSLSQFVVVRT